MPFNPPPQQGNLLRIPRAAPGSPPPRDIAKRPDKPRELKERRSERSKTWVRPNGAKYIQVFPYAIHQRGRNGGWEDLEDRPNHNIGLFSMPMTPLSTALYAAGSSFDQGGQQAAETMTLYHYLSDRQTL